MTRKSIKDNDWTSNDDKIIFTKLKLKKITNQNISAGKKEREIYVLENKAKFNYNNSNEIETVQPGSDKSRNKVTTSENFTNATFQIKDREKSPGFDKSRNKVTISENISDTTIQIKDREKSPGLDKSRNKVTISENISDTAIQIKVREKGRGLDKSRNKVTISENISDATIHLKDREKSKQSKDEGNQKNKRRVIEDLMERRNNNTVLSGNSTSTEINMKELHTLLESVGPIPHFETKVKCNVVVPNIVHLVEFSDNKTKEFVFHKLISVLSVIKIQQPDAIYFWHDTVPHGKWWTLLQLYIKKMSVKFIMKKIEAPERVFSVLILRIEHKADVQRISCIEEYGGIYIDLDVVIIKPLTQLMCYNFTLGKEDGVTLNNGIIIGVKQMDGSSHDNVAIDLGDPYLGIGIDTDDKPKDDTTHQSDNEDLEEDFTMFLDEIAGDVEIEDDNKIPADPQLLPEAHHPGLDDITEEDDEEEYEETDETPKEQQPIHVNRGHLNQINQTIIVSDSEGDSPHHSEDDDSHSVNPLGIPLDVLHRLREQSNLCDNQSDTSSIHSGEGSPKLKKVGFKVDSEKYTPSPKNQRRGNQLQDNHNSTAQTRKPEYETGILVPHKNQLFHGHGHGKPGLPTIEQEARRFMGSQVKLGQRRSSMTPLGMSSLKNDFSTQPQTRKLSMPQISENESESGKLQYTFDHTPHELFVELDELYSAPDGHFEWKQRARWIKFEENVEEGANRWGKPHVSSLSFHSLLDLRKCIEQGVVLLDLEESTMQAIASRMTEELCKIDQLRAEHRGQVIKLLLNKHKHLEGWSFLGRRRSSQLFGGAPSTGMRRRGSINVQPPTTGRRMSLFPSFKTADKKVARSPAIDRRSSLPVPKDQLTNGSTADKHALDSVVINNNNSSDNMAKEELEEELPLPTVPMKHLADPAILKRIPEGSETVAVLVGEVEYLDKPLAAFVRLSEGCHIDNLTEVPLPVRFVFLLLGSSQTCLDYKEIGRAIATLMSNTHFGDIAYKAEQTRDLLKALTHFLDESIVLPPGGMDEKVLLPIIDIAKKKEQEMKEKTGELQVEEKKPLLPFDPFKRTKRPFGGLINDIKFRFPLYLSDIKDGLNLQSFAAFFFIYFACLTPTVTFGGLLSDKTDQWIGVSEMMLGSFILGVIFSLVGGQPLMIVGGSAPLLVFEEALYQVSNSFELDFLSFRFWVSTWNALFTVIVIAVEGIFLVRFITGFTKDVFAMLIPLIFIIETFIKINKYFVKHPLAADYPIINEENSLLGDSLTNNSAFIPFTTQTVSLENYTELNVSTLSPNILDNGVDRRTGQPNTALFSMVLTLGTFFIAYNLKQLKTNYYLGRTARRLISDFGVPIAIAIMVVVDILVKDTYTEKLNVPDGVTPTDATKRGWFVPPMGHTKPLPVWAIFAAIIPGLLLFILLFMEVLITSMIVNKKERKLKKGPGYNIDFLIIGTFTVASGLFGFPYLSVPIVRCIAQIQALEVFSKTHAPGEKPKLEKVQEHRLVNFFVHVMIGLSTLLGPVLREIPIAVLFGVFLFMGVTALSGSNLFDRVLLMFMPPKHHPNVGYVTKVRMWKMHLYTALQLVCLAVLWAVKSTKAALGFPFVLILMVPFRLYLVKFLFKEEELIELDSDTTQILKLQHKPLEQAEQHKDNQTLPF